MKKLPGLLGVLLILAGCTSRNDSARSASPRASTSASPSPGPTHTADEEDHGHETEEEKLTRGFTPEKPPPSGFVPSTTQSPPPGHLTLAVKFAPTCVEKGEKITLTAKTNRPKVRVSFITPMENEDGRATERDGSTDSNGLWDWTFKVPEDTPSRTFEMLGASVDEHKEGEGNAVLGNWHFVVADPGRCA